ncbi:MAG: transposase [Armatimonadetes bacterium]|nr:transposase [Armatimonadota bacterium]
MESRDLYALKTGCPWRQLPHDLPPCKTVYYHFRRWQKRGVGRTGAGAGGQSGAQVSCGGQLEYTVHRKGGHAAMTGARR